MVKLISLIININNTREICQYRNEYISPNEIVFVEIWGEPHLVVLKLLLAVLRELSGVQGLNLDCPRTRQVPYLLYFLQSPNYINLNVSLKLFFYIFLTNKNDNLVYHSLSRVIQ